MCEKRIEDFTLKELRDEIKRRKDMGDIEIVWEQLEWMKFRCVCTAAWEDEHTMTYVNENGRIGFCVHTPKRENGEFGKSRIHWRIDKKVYKTTKGFLKALKDYSEKVIPIESVETKCKHGHGICFWSGIGCNDCPVYVNQNENTLNNNE